MEQLSHERELEYLTAHPNPEDREEGYGVVLLNFCIRDLQGKIRQQHGDFASVLTNSYFVVGVGISHLTGKGKSVIEAAINIGLRKIQKNTLNFSLYSYLLARFTWLIIFQKWVVVFIFLSQLSGVFGQMPHGERALGVHLDVVLYQRPAGRLVSARHLYYRL